MSHNIGIPSELHKGLVALAEGYFFESKDDRYIVIDNPKFCEDDGSDPKLVIDISAYTATHPSTPIDRDSVLEEAAKVAEARLLELGLHTPEWWIASQIITAIRALKDTP